MKFFGEVYKENPWHLEPVDRTVGCLKPQMVEHQRQGLFGDWIILQAEKQGLYLLSSSFKKPWGTCLEFQTLKLWQAAMRKNEDIKQWCLCFISQNILNTKCCALIYISLVRKGKKAALFNKTTSTINLLFSLLLVYSKRISSSLPCTAVTDPGKQISWSPKGCSRLVYTLCSPAAVTGWRNGC